MQRFAENLLVLFSLADFDIFVHDLFTDVHVISDLLEAWMSIDFLDTLSKGFGRDFGSLWLALGFHLTPAGFFLSLPHCFVRSPLASFTHFVVPGSSLRRRILAGARRILGRRYYFPAS